MQNTTGGFKSARQSGLTARKRTVSRFGTAFRNTFSSGKSKVTHFRTTALHRIARLSRFTRRCIIRQRVNYQTPFDTYRPQL